MGIATAALSEAAWEQGTFGQTERLGDCFGAQTGFMGRSLIRTTVACQAIRRDVIPTRNGLQVF